MRTSFRLTEAEFLDAQRLNFARGRGRTSDLLLRASAVLPLALAVVFAIVRQPVFTVIMIAMAALIAGYRWLLVPRSWRKLYREDARWSHEVAIEPSDRGIRVDTPSTHADIAWGQFARFVESTRLVLLYRDREAVVTIVPKRAFGGEDLSRFLELLHRRMARPRRPAGPNTIRT
jgi:hypothetical protein